MKVSLIQPSDAIISLFSQKIKPIYEIEHLCSSEVWEMWKSKNLVSLRSDAEIRNMFDGLVPRDKSLDCVIDELVSDISIRDTILTFEPQELKKKQMVSCLREHFSNNSAAFTGFEKTIQDIESYFSK